MTSLLNGYTLGLILGLMVLGVFISFRLFRFPDITTEGSITLGAAVATSMIIKDVNPWLATGLSFFAGMLAGSITGVLHTKFKVNELLSGILVMTALYTVNLRIMKQSNISIYPHKPLFPTPERGSASEARVDLLGWEVGSRDLQVLAIVAIVTILAAVALNWFLKSDFGTAMRATGDSPQMVRAMGVNAERMIVLGIALANGLIAVSGALMAQYQGFADVQMGFGMVVSGLASVIIGESLIGSKGVGYMIVGAVLGSILYRLLVAIALRAGLEASDLKLITAVFVFAALVIPRYAASLLKRPVSEAKPC